MVRIFLKVMQLKIRKETDAISGIIALVPEFQMSNYVF
jgi:hypothetical protein